MGNELVLRLSSLIIGIIFGNILTAFFIAKLFGAVRPTEFGSGNPGTANVGAVLGKKAGIMVLAGDLLKSILAFVLTWTIFKSDIQLAFLYCGLGLTLGHDFPIWNKFKGGKGVAVSVVYLLLIDFKWGLIALLSALVLLIFIKNLILPPILFMLIMTIHFAIVGKVEFVIIFLLATLVMIWQYRFDLRDLIQGNAKQVDILKTVKKKFKPTKND